MKLFGFHISRRDPEARTHVVVPQSGAEAYDQFQMAARNLRRGMWVMQAGLPRAAILTGIDLLGAATIMLVKEDGTNELEIKTDANSIRQATINEVPASRRHMGDDVFESMGYRRS